MQKKNKILMMAISSLLCLTLISSCLVSSVFAKYVTKHTADIPISFKKWGVTVTADVRDDFDEIATVEGEDGSATVTISGLNMKPGDDFSDAVRFTITGTPQVKCRVTVIQRFTYGTLTSTGAERESAIDAMRFFGAELGISTSNSEYWYVMPAGLTFGTGYYNTKTGTYTPTLYKDANNNDVKYVYISEPWRLCKDSGVSSSDLYRATIRDACRDKMIEKIDSCKASSYSWSNARGIDIDFEPNSEILFYPKGQTHSDANKMNSFTFGFVLPYTYDRLDYTVAPLNSDKLDEIATYVSENCNGPILKNDGSQRYSDGRFTFTMEYRIIIEQIS